MLHAMRHIHTPQLKNKAVQNILFLEKEKDLNVITVKRVLSKIKEDDDTFLPDGFLDLIRKTIDGDSSVKEFVVYTHINPELINITTEAIIHL